MSEGTTAISWEEEGFYGSSGAGGKCQVLVTDERTYLFWVEAGFNNDTLWFQWSDGEIWTVPTYIANTRPHPYERGYDIDEDDGVIHLAWQTWIDEDRDIYYLTFDGTSWSSQVLLTAEKKSSNQTDPSIVTVGSQVFVAYKDDSRRLGGIYLRHYDGTSWKPAEKLSTDDPEDDTVANPQLARWGKQVLLTWRGAEGIRLVKYDGTTWSKPTTVVSEIYASPYQAYSITSSADAAFIAYLARPGSDILVNLTRNDGSGWSLPETVNATPVHHVASPCIAADAGYVCLVYTDANERISFSYHNGTGWSSPEVLNTTKEDGQWYPHMTFTDGTARVVFHHRLMGHNLLQYLEGDLEVAPPSSQASVSGPYWTDAATVEVNWVLTDDYGIADITLESRYSVDNGTWSDWTEFMFEDGETGTHAAGTTTFDTSGKDGHYQFRSTATDVWGNVEPAPTEPEATLGLDTTAPKGSIQIEGGNDYTTTTTVTLSLTFDDVHSGVIKVRFGNEAIGGDEPWEDPVEEKEWELEQGSGTRAVVFQVMDAVGTISEVYSSDIVLDTDQPYGGIGIPGGNSKVRIRTVTLAPSYGDATSPVAGIRLSNDGIWDAVEWMDPSDNVTWTLTERDGEKTVYYQVMDSAGQVSQTYTFTLMMDSVAPYVMSTDPEEGEKDVDRNSTLTVIFSEPMNRTSVEEAIRITYFDEDHPAMMGGKDFEWSPDGKMVTFRPDRSYGRFTEHMLRIHAQNTTDLAGNPLHSQVDVNYTVTLLDIPDNGNGDGDDNGDDGSLWGIVVALVIIVVVLVALVGYLMMRGKQGDG